jgi:hypothetical protein
MSWVKQSLSSPDARVACVSFREADPIISRCLRFEFEDAIAGIDRVDILSPVRSMKTSRLDRVIARLDCKAPALARLRPDPALSRRYDLLFVTIQTIGDVYAFAPWSAWRRGAGRSVCLIEEMYARDVANCRAEVEILKQFDTLFVGCQGTVEALSRATGRPVHYLPHSADALAFCPFPDAPERVIDFYSMGRRPRATHEALLRIADRSDFFYHYDTVSNVRVTDYLEHRRRLVDMVRRTRYFLTNMGKCNEPGHTGGQQELGFRFFEGAAAGCVLIGDPPRNDAFRDLFTWPDSVLPLEFGSGAIEPIIRALDADPARVERIRRANVVQSLRRHDHSYRWAQVLAAVGMEPLPALAARAGTLAALADSIERPASSYTRPAVGPAPAMGAVG